MARSVLIEFRRGTAAAWTAANPVLAAGEPGWETDTSKLKVGDGATAWNALSYFSGGGIGTIASPGGSISVTNPTGPTADLDLPASGVVAGSYGDATDVAQVTVNAKGIVTALTAIPIAGGAANMRVLFDSLLGADAASIDTGANGIAQTAKHLLIYFSFRTAQASVLSSCTATWNGDSSASYDRITGTATGTGSVGIGSGFAANGFGLQQLGANADAANFGAAVIVVPDYTSANAKSFFVLSGAIGTAVATNSLWQLSTIRYRVAAAFTQLTVSGAGNNIKAGSRLTIYGLG